MSPKQILPSGRIPFMLKYPQCWGECYLSKKPFPFQHPSGLDKSFLFSRITLFFTVLSLSSMDILLSVRGLPRLHWLSLFLRTKKVRCYKCISVNSNYSSRLVTLRLGEPGLAGSVLSPSRAASLGPTRSTGRRVQ